MSQEPWEIYYDAFERRAARIPAQLFERERDFAEAAHDAYRFTADRLSEHDHWDPDRTLLVTRAFGQTVKEWIAAGQHDLPALRDQLRARWSTLTGV
jgi:hypothetical protein